MNRRELLLGAAAMAAAVTASKAFAAEHEHMAHDHKSGRNAQLIAAAADCALKANICLQHCIVRMGQGEKELANCARSASNLMSMCETLQHFASAESRFLPQVAKLAMEICKDCEEECKKTEKHPECKACGEACAACYKECKKIAV